MTTPMNPKEPHLYVEFPPQFSNEVLDEFLQAVASPALTVKVERHEKGPQAGIEWLLPTAAFVFVTRSFFDGLGKEVAKDVYPILKKAVGKLWGYLSTVTTSVFASSAGKRSDDRYSRTFCVLARSESGRMVKLLVPSNATREEVEASVEAFGKFLETFYSGEPVPMTFNGGVALVTYDPTTTELRQVHPRLSP